MSGTILEGAPLEERQPCEDCGDPNGRGEFTGECRNHPEYALCRACRAFFPLMEGTFLPGTPDVHYRRNGDPGYPGDPAEFYCPTYLEDADSCEGDNPPLSWSEIIASAEHGPTWLAADLRDAFRTYLCGGGKEAERDLVGAFEAAGYGRVEPWVSFQIKLLVGAPAPEHTLLRVCEGCGHAFLPGKVPEGERQETLVGTFCAPCVSKRRDTWVYLGPADSEYPHLARILDGWNYAIRRLTNGSVTIHKSPADPRRRGHHVTPTASLMPAYDRHPTVSAAVAEAIERAKRWVEHPPR